MLSSPVIGRFESLLALFTPPSHRPLLHQLLVATLGRASRVRETRRLVRVPDKHNRAPQVEVIRFVALSQVLVLDLGNRLGHVLAATAAAHGLSRKRVEVGLLPTTLVPARETVAFGNVGVDGDGAGREGREGAAAKVADAGVFDGDDGVALVVELHGLFAPQGEADRLVRVVDDGQVALLELWVRGAGQPAELGTCRVTDNAPLTLKRKTHRLLGRLGDNLLHLTKLLDHTNHIHRLVLFVARNVGNRHKVVTNRRDPDTTIGRFLHNRVILEVDFVGARAVLALLGLLDLGLGNVVDIAVLDLVVVLGTLVVESRCADFAGFVEEGDGKELAFATLVGPGLDVGLVGGAGADGPPVGKESACASPRSIWTPSLSTPNPPLVVRIQGIDRRNGTVGRHATDTTTSGLTLSLVSTIARRSGTSIRRPVLVLPEPVVLLLGLLVVLRSLVLLLLRSGSLGLGLSLLLVGLFAGGVNVGRGAYLVQVAFVRGKHVHFQNNDDPLSWN